MIIDFSNTKLPQIINWIESTKGEIEFLVSNPSLGQGLYAGEFVECNGNIMLHRSLRVWVNMAQTLGYYIDTPQIINRCKIVIKLIPLQQNSFHNITNSKNKYDSNSYFARINKCEESGFWIYYKNALKAINLQNRKTILDIGINRGDEIIAFENIISKEIFSSLSIIGVDYSHGAINEASKLLPNAKLYAKDIKDFLKSNTIKFDLIISIATLQSSTINMKPLVMNLIQNHLDKDGAIIFGFPNSRWIDGELVYGAKAPNYNYSELSLVIKDIYWIKKYLQQHKFRVTITGKEYLFVTATKICS